MTILTVLALTLFIGVAVGLLGGGGSILTVPLLVHVAGQDPKTAIATSLVVVAATSAAGLVTHARAGRVRWRTGLVFGGAGMVGAYAAGRAAAVIPGEVLLAVFGVMMAATAIAMLRGPAPRPTRPARTHGTPPVARILLDGLVVGAVTGLVGAGGGFLVVPALVLLGGLPMTAAIGTSLVVVTLKSSAGLAGYLASTPVDWRLAGLMTAVAVVGSVVGSRSVGRVPQETLRRVFGGFVLLMTVVVLGPVLADPVADATPLAHGAATALASALVGAVLVTALALTRRGVRPPSRSAAILEPSPTEETTP